LKVTEAYGFVCNSSLSRLHNLSLALANTPLWLYLCRPTNTAFHNLCLPSTRLPPGIKNLLGLGLNFCPRSEYSTASEQVDLDRFIRDCKTKMFFAGSAPFPKKALFIRSNWCPPEEDIPKELTSRLKSFYLAICKAFRKRRSWSNLTPLQLATLNNLRSRNDLVVFNCDKNLGPAIIERSRYIALIKRDHLSDCATYRQLTEFQAFGRMKAIQRILEGFISRLERNNVIRRDTTFLRRSMETRDPFSYFYALAKVHKPTLSTRPIVSTSGSILHGLGRWVDKYLQALCKSIPYRTSSSLALVKELRTLNNLPPTARFFTCDATSMYTNIDATDALLVIKDYLVTTNACAPLGIESSHLISGLEIIMRHNLFRFGDTYWTQLRGTAMGTPPAVMYATLYFFCYERRFIPTQNCLRFYTRYIDDCFGIWVPDPLNSDSDAAEAWLAFTTEFNSLCSLDWIFTDLSHSVEFLDLTITINTSAGSTAISTNLFEKAMNLYLYLPSHSAHPPGILKGLVFGMILRIYRLSSDLALATKACNRFFQRLTARGYSISELNAMASKVNTNALLRSIREDSPSLYLHLPYNPADPPSQSLQQIFRSVLRCSDDSCLSKIRNKRGLPFGIRRLTIAYSRPPNLGNLFSPRKLHGTGTLVSTTLRQLSCCNESTETVSTTQTRLSCCTEHAETSHENAQFPCAHHLPTVTENHSNFSHESHSPAKCSDNHSRAKSN
jgi:hypothetical protein